MVPHSATIASSATLRAPARGRTNANGTPAKEKKRCLLPPLHHHPKEHGNKAAPKASESTQEREAEAELGALTSHSQPRGPKISVSVSVAGGAEGVIAEDIERHKRLGYVPWDPRSRVKPSSNDSSLAPTEASTASATPDKADSDSTSASDAVSTPEPDPGSTAESESTQKQDLYDGKTTRRATGLRRTKSARWSQGEPSDRRMT